MTPKQASNSGVVYRPSSNAESLGGLGVLLVAVHANIDDHLVGRWALGTEMTSSSERHSPELSDELARRLSWDALCEQLRSNTELDEELRNRALDVTRRLRQTLGESWPARLRLNRRSQLVECFFNGAPHAFASLVSAGETVIGLRDIKGWRKVVGRIPTEGERAIAELGVAARALRAGFEIELEPKTVGRHRADLLIRDFRTQLYAEVFVAEPVPKIAYDIEAVENAILPQLRALRMGLMIGGGFLRVPSESDIPSLAAQVTDCLERARKSTGIQNLDIPGILKLRVVHVDDPDYEACVKSGLVGDFRGSQFGYDPLGRLLAAVRRKSRQLPHNEPGMLVITPPSFLGQPAAADELVEAIRATLSSLPQVVALVLLWRQLSSLTQDQEHFVRGGATLRQTVIHPPLVERLLFTPNPNADRGTALAVARTTFGVGHAYS